MAAYKGGYKGLFCHDEGNNQQIFGGGTTDGVSIHFFT